LLFDVFPSNLAQQADEQTFPREALFNFQLNCFCLFAIDSQFSLNYQRLIKHQASKSLFPAREPTTIEFPQQQQRWAT